MIKKIMMVLALVTLVCSASFADVYIKDIDGTNVDIVFTFKDDSATEMNLIGDYCGWVEPGTPMAKNADGKWELTLKSTMDSTIKYKFWYKGTYIYDFKAPDKIDDGFGGNNGLIEVSKAFAKQKAKELAASGDAAGAAALMSSAGGSGIKFATWTMIGAQGKFLTQGMNDKTTKGLDLNLIELGAKSYNKFSGEAVPGLPFYVELAVAESGMDDAGITLLQKDEYGNDSVVLKESLLALANNMIASPVAYLSKANDQAGSNPARGDCAYLGHLRYGFSTKYVNVENGFNYAKPPVRQAITWTTVDGGGWDAGYEHAGGYFQISNGSDIQEFGDVKVNVAITPNKSADRKGTKFGTFNYANVVWNGFTFEVQYNSMYDGDYFFSETTEQDIIAGAKGSVAGVTFAVQGLAAIHGKEFLTAADNAQDYFGYSTDTFWRTKEFGLKNVAANAKVGYAADIFEVNAEYRMRGSQASMLYVRENHDDEVWTLSDQLGVLNSQRVKLTGKVTPLSFLAVGLDASAEMRLQEFSADDLASINDCWSWYSRDVEYKYQDGAEFEFKPNANVKLADFGFDATVDLYTTLDLTTQSFNDVETVYGASDSSFLFKNLGLKVAMGPLNDIINGIDVIYGLDNSDDARMFNTLLATVKFPGNFNVDLGFGLRSINGSEAGKALVAEELNAFGASFGVSKTLTGLQKPIVYAQFVYNMDPYKAFGDGQEVFNLDGYVLNDGVSDFDGEAACRMGIRWAI